MNSVFLFLFQFDEDSVALLTSWIPRKLGPNIRCILSLVDGSEHQKALMSRESKPQEFTIGPMETRERQVCGWAALFTNVILPIHNSLAPGRYQNDFKRAIFKLTSWIWFFSNSCKIVFRRMPLDPTDKSTLVRVMAWWRRATSHYLNQCWQYICVAIWRH